MLAKLKARSPEQGRKGRNNADDWYKEAPEALDFKLDGEQTIDGRATFVIEFSPHSDYHPSNIWARVLLKMSGKVWVDANGNGQVDSGEADWLNYNSWYGLTTSGPGKPTATSRSRASMGSMAPEASAA